MTLDRESGGFDPLRHEVRISGNAWLTGDLGPGRARFVVDWTREMEIYDAASLQKIRREEMRARAASGGSTNAPLPTYPGFDADVRVGGKWRPADLKRDAARVVEFLDRAAQKDALNWRYQENAYGSVFLFAAHVHRSGLAEEANRIVERLFDASGDGRQVVVQGLNVLADGQYEDAYAAFRAGGDWTAFRDALNRLLARFDTGWQKRGGLQRLADLIGQRLENPEPPAVAGDGVTAEDVALLRHLESGPAPVSLGYRARLWVLPPTPGDEGAEFRRGSGPLKALIDRRMKSVPLLMAMLSDDYLLPWHMEAMRGMTHYGSSYDSDSPPEETADRVFRQMSRPARRSDVARELLVPLLPVGEDSGDGFAALPADRLREDVMAWYAGRKDAPPEELAMSYVEHGDGVQRSEALTYLMAVLPADRLAAVEKHLVDEDDPRDGLSAVQSYADARGPEAREFVEGYIRKLEAQLDETSAGDMTPDEDFVARMRKDHTNQVNELREAVSGRSVEDTLAAVAAGREPVEKVERLLNRRLNRQTPEQALDLLLPWVPRVEAAETRERLLDLLFDRPQLQGLVFLAMRSGELDVARGMGQDESSLAFDVAPHAEHWRTLLADQRVLAGDPAALPAALADRAAWAMELLYDPQHGAGSYALVNRLGRLGFDVLRARAAARLEGQGGAIPPYPAAENVDAARRAGMAADLSAAAPADVAGLVGALSAAELLCLSEAASTNRALNRALAPAANRLRAVETSLQGEDIEGLRRQLGGRSLDRSAVEPLLAFCRGRLSAGRPLRVAALREPCLGGVTVRIVEPADPEEAGGAAPATCGVTAAARLPGGRRAAAFWEAPGAEATARPVQTIAAGAAPPAEAEALLKEMIGEADASAGRDGEAANAGFWRAVDALSSNDVNACEAAWISFSINPARK